MAARRMSVSLDHSRPERLEHELVRRDDEDGENAEATLSLTTPLPERILLYPLPVGSRNKTGGGGGDKNTAGQSQSATKTDIQVSCVDCSTSGSLLVKAAFDFDLLGTDNNTVGSLEVGKLDAASLYIELAEDFNATANLEIFAGASTSLSFQQSIFPLGPIALSPFNLGGVLSVGPLFDFEVVLDIAGPSGSVNMSYGTELVVPKGSKANLTYGANNQSFASGWDEARIHEIPFNVTALDGELSFGVNLTARPRFTFGIQMLGGAVATLDAGFEADLPKVYAKATAVTNVTSTCAPAGAGNGTYYPAAIKLETGLGLELRAVAGFEAGGQGILPALIDQTFSYPLLSKDFPGAELCYGFDEKALGTMFPITDKKPLSPNATAPAEGAHAVDSGAVKVEMGPLGMLMAVGAGVFLL
ncbi:hypothetical protein FN846DRAFT_971049 [Sphaerosporella brunnea]|uniref:DUF7223 domain-containing protein n=1 Tax=Sphaerosporella brunnea TaxID=1250544 RepID=A0A5J5EIW4_9PEZI|nr:hypothetical protein FN846DRAFT_971049 [Sphaerosporella brunnea]